MTFPSRIALGFLAALALLFAFFLLSLAPLKPAHMKGAYARDYGQWEGTDPKVKLWYQNLKQPDSGFSCCGEGDAYWADEETVEDDGHGGKRVFAIITDDRADKPLGRVHEDVGTRYVIPENKITRVDGNPTGHVVLFLGYPTYTVSCPYGAKCDRAEPRKVLCYVLNGGV